MLSVRPFLWHNKATKGAELMPEIIPIRDLKNTNAISQRCHETQEPIFVTKSGYGDMVIMSIRAPRMLSGEFLFISSRVFFLALRIMRCCLSLNSAVIIIVDIISNVPRKIHETI